MEATRDQRKDPGPPPGRRGPQVWSRATLRNLVLAGSPTERTVLHFGKYKKSRRLGETSARRPHGAEAQATRGKGTWWA